MAREKRDDEKKRYRTRKRSSRRSRRRRSSRKSSRKNENKYSLNDALSAGAMGFLGGTLLENRNSTRNSTDEKKKRQIVSMDYMKEIASLQKELEKEKMSNKSNVNKIESLKNELAVMKAPIKFSKPQDVCEGGECNPCEKSRSLDYKTKVGGVQNLKQCGMHATNNLVGWRLATCSMLENIGKAMVKDAASFGYQTSQGYNDDGTGAYAPHVLAQTINLRTPLLKERNGIPFLSKNADYYKAKVYNISSDKNYIGYYNPIESFRESENVLGCILATRFSNGDGGNYGHFLACRKLYKENKWCIIDSLSPGQFNYIERTYEGTLRQMYTTI